MIKLLLIFMVLMTSYGVYGRTLKKYSNKKTRPNIIFLLSDDQRDNTFGAMGHPYIKSPNVDKLIHNGVRFSNTYAAEPICAPSRVAFFTGLNERMSGVGFTSLYKVTDEQWDYTYPELLRKSGYYTGMIGKFGIEYYTFKGNAKSKFDYWRSHDGWAKFWTKTAPNCSIYEDAGENIITPIMGESITKFLDSTPKDKPFCLSVSFSIPHGSQIKSMYPGNKDAEECKIPANRYYKLKGNPFYDTLYRNSNVQVPKEVGTDPYQRIPKTVLDQNKGRANNIYKFDYTDSTCYEHRIRYYQQISAMDDVIGKMVTSLKKRGLSKNTIIIFASDHGLLMGEHAMGGKALLYDLSSKIPCIIYDPNLKADKKGTTDTNLVSSVDITSTILDYAGVVPPKDMQGKSLLPLLTNDNSKWRNEIYLESLYTGRGNPICEGIRKGNWKYIRMYQLHKGRYSESDLDFRSKKPDFEQLFNLKDDPKENSNLIGKYKGSKILTMLRDKTAKHFAKQNKERQNYMKKTDVVKR